MDLTDLCLDYLPDDLIGLLWRLFRMGPSTRGTVCWSWPADEDARQDRCYWHFLDFHDELRRVRARRPVLRARDARPAVAEGVGAAVA
jgi:hypothetical protein